MKDVSKRRFRFNRRLPARYISDIAILLRDITRFQNATGVEAIKEITNIFIHRVAQKFARSADLHHPPAFHDRNAVTDANRFFYIVGDENDRAVLLGLELDQLPCISLRIIGSSAENASSISRMAGSLASARARPTRCCIPPESW